MKANDIVKKYAYDKEHLLHTAEISLMLFDELKKIFLRLENYDNEKDRNLLYYGALLHDIGIKMTKIYNLPHHKAAQKFILENGPDEIEKQDLKVLSCLVRYHRKSLPDENAHDVYKSLNQQNRAKVCYLGAVIRLCDALDGAHIGLINNIKASYSKPDNTLTLSIAGLDKDAYLKAQEKKDFFISSYDVKLNIVEV